MAGLDIGGAQGVAQLRAAFRQEGFHAPDVEARVLSEICNQTFSADQLLAEQDDYAAQYLLDPTNSQRVWAKGPLETQARASKSGLPAKYHRILEGAKRTELALLPSLSVELIKKRTDIRKVAEEIAAASGFARRKASGGGPTRVSKVYPTAGIEGLFDVDVGGRRGSLWSGTNIQFYIASEDRGGRSIPIVLFRIVRGIVHYGSAAPALEEIMSGPVARDHEPELVSDLLKVGVLAQVRFFDLFLTKLDEVMRANG